MSASLKGPKDGRTKDTIQHAPDGAIFVWSSDRLSYPRRLARWLRRDDLQIIGPSAMANELQHAEAGTCIVLDHGTILAPETLDKIDVMNSRAVAMSDFSLEDDNGKNRSKR